jgi:hypothetical protein
MSCSKSQFSCSTKFKIFGEIKMPIRELDTLFYAAGISRSSAGKPARQDPTAVVRTRLVLRESLKGVDLRGIAD